MTTAFPGRRGRPGPARPARGRDPASVASIVNQPGKQAVDVRRSCGDTPVILAQGIPAEGILRHYRCSPAF